MASPLDATFGVWLVSIWLQTLLQGCGLLQAFLYFHWYPKDSWRIKAMVIILICIETFQIVLFFSITYFYLIDEFGNFTNLDVIYWQDSAQLFVTYLSAFIVQLYFGYCIYVLDKKHLVLPIIILVLALTQIAAGLAQTVLTHRVHLFSDLESTKPVTTLEAASALCCDLTITFSLLYRLKKHKGGVKTTDSVLNTLMVNAVNRGMLTAICAAINMILFIAKPNTFYFFIGLLLSGKLYMNSALATLNSRKHVIAKSQGTSDEPSSGRWNSIQMEPRRGRTQDNAEVRIVVDQQSHVERDSDMDVKKPRYMEGIA
ncbi:hypothetical protein HYPSUDRAFT_206301 [Hypholoma sublateritium FD-334 SS-4]|uniref:DUF6534 domain-containing protein n=1 Tax=Hypholoma sublateritium (strain FD-334 SS-4) TaxID=945553 RepID=A0A0D2NL76_HYPSF|nr:hypothetical protein HYPSUDRAFT_206301 [Hypholoma sublateritium FD-334 SS-4]